MEIPIVDANLSKLFTLLRSEIHVWQAYYDETWPRQDKLYATLSSDERLCAERFYFPQDTSHYIFSHGILRYVLGKYLFLSPEDIHFHYNRHAKPYLSAAIDRQVLSFNMSHSGQWVLIAVAQGREVGIDVEKIRIRDHLHQIAEYFFSPQEYTALTAMPAEQRVEAFFTYWTRREAYLKALGVGISGVLDSVDLPVSDGKPVFLVAGEASAREDCWRYVGFRPAPEYMAAVVVEGDDWELKRFILEGEMES
jgi:Phosphopantetheinyl transferase